MRNTTRAAALALGLLTSFNISTSNAASVTPATPAVYPVSTSQSVGVEGLVQQAAYGNSCRKWNWECRSRWGWGWRYRRCMARHGC